MIRVGVVGLGKMGLSHLAMLRAHPDVEIAGVVDSTGYMLDVLAKYTGVQTFGEYDAMLSAAELDAVLIATPTQLHADMVRKALDRGVSVFCEKPLCLSAVDSQALTELAHERSLVTQVGYHNRYVGAFAEIKRLLDNEAIGKVTHILAEAYGPVVLREKGSTWRSRKSEGGGSLYDYAAHPLDLVTWYFGEPTGVAGTVLGSVFSAETDDEVFGTIYFQDGISGQISVNWSDESVRKMTTKITVWGTQGHIFADRQECQVFLRDGATVPDGYDKGWNVKYTTELTQPVWFYLRGEEYSAQLADFVRRVGTRQTDGINTFASGAVTDRLLGLLQTDAELGPRTTGANGQPSTSPRIPAERPKDLAVALAKSVGRRAADLQVLDRASATVRRVQQRLSQRREGSR